MIHRTTFMLAALPVLSLSAYSASAADEISLNQSRPMMKLAGELAARYGYLVTYEDAPPDAAHEVLKMRVRQDVDFFYPAWSRVVFHVNAREGTAAAASEEPLRVVTTGGSVRVRSAGPVRPLEPKVIDPDDSGHSVAGSSVLISYAPSIKSPVSAPPVSTGPLAIARE
jgi:hypothetical protein